MTAYQLIKMVGMVSLDSANAARPEHPILIYEKVFSLLLIICIILLAAGVVLWIVRIVRRYVVQQREAAASAARFEGEMAREFGGTSGPMSHADASPLVHQLVANDHVSSELQPPSHPEELDMEHATAKLIKKLQAGGLYIGMEGTISLGQGSLQGQIVRLRDNKIALIVPSVQSEQFLAHHARRFDFLFVLLNSDQVVVIQKYQDFVADRMPFP